MFMLKKTIVHWLGTLVSHVSWMIFHNLHIYSPCFHWHHHDVPIGSCDDLMMLTWCFDVVPIGSHDVHITFWKCCSHSHFKVHHNCYQYLPHSEFKSYQINSIKSSSHQDLSNNTKGTFQFLQNFQWRHHSLFKNFYTHNSKCHHETKPMMHPPCWELSKETKNMIWSTPVRWISS